MVAEAVDVEAARKRRVEECDEEDDEEEEEEEEDESDVDRRDDGLNVTSSCRAGALALNDLVHDEESRAPNFQNIEVTNSSDVHFGNKTYYQGPVTIKQILYTNHDDKSEVSTNQKLPIANGAFENGGYVMDSATKSGDGQIDVDAATSANNGSNNNWTGKAKGKWLRSLSTKKLIALMAVITAVVFLVSIAVIVFLVQRPERSELNVNGEDFVDNVPDSDPEDPDVNITMIPKWVDRRNWLARPEKPGVVLLKTPVPYVVIHHTATEECRVLADCKGVVRSIQDFHMNSNHWSDVGYNFLVGGDGYIYEARGYTKQGAHVKGYNNVSIGIAFIGTFKDHLPPNKTLNAAKEVIRKGVEEGYIRKDYKLFGMQQLSTFSSPGARLYKEIKTWPHWSASLTTNDDDLPTTETTTWITTQ